MEVGYILKHDCRGRGYALEGARGCVDYAFRHWGVPSVIAEIRPENKASLAVAEKLGFSLRDEIVKVVQGKEMRHLVYAGDTPLVKVVPARKAWTVQFESLKRRVGEALEGICFRIEHVGSTSVPGLAAKPIIDADIILEDWSLFPEVAKRLEQAGWRHRSDLGIPGREAFAASMRLDFAHHLYVCRDGIAALDNHLKLRDYLRCHPDAAERYGSAENETGFTLSGKRSSLLCREKRSDRGNAECRRDCTGRIAENQRGQQPGASGGVWRSVRRQTLSCCRRCFDFFLQDSRSGRHFRFSCCAFYFSITGLFPRNGFSLEFRKTDFAIFAGADDFPALFAFVEETFRTSATVFFSETLQFMIFCREYLAGLHRIDFVDCFLFHNQSSP